MKKNDIKKDMLCRYGETVLRVLEIKEESALVINCIKMTMPKWISISDLHNYVTITSEELLERTGMYLSDTDNLSMASKKVMHERYTMIAGILPFVGDKRTRSNMIADYAETYGVSKNTLKNYLCWYLAYKNIAILAPKDRKDSKCLELTQDEKNMRWALNKYYYTRNKQSLSTVYTLMLKEKYCDGKGQLLDKYPSIYQFRYFYKKTKKYQTYYIARNGLKDYQRNNRPLLGDGVQSFVSVGVGMLDSTICDIYLVDEAGNLVGRPILVACVDAYSSFCYGYSLLWEGGVYSLRNLMLNVIEDKVEWCKKFGVLIEKGQWDCDCLPAMFMTDMGTEYTSGNFEQITELGVTIQNLPAYRPELKGPVEKFFDLIQSEYKKHLKGKGVIEPDYQERGAHDYRKDACLTMRDFETVILRCILYYNSQRIMENFPYTERMLQEGIQPYAASIFAWGRMQAGSNLIHVSREKLVLTLLPRTRGFFTRFGLKVNRLRYHAEGYVEQYLKGGEAVVAYNPDDVGRVWLYENGDYIVFELIENRFRGKSLSEAQKLTQDCKEMIRMESARNLQAKIDLAEHIQSVAGNVVQTKDTKFKDIRKTRQKEQRKTHVDFMKGGAANDGDRKAHAENENRR